MRLPSGSASSARRGTAIFPGDADPADLARYISAVIYGMAVHAAGGASPEDLRRIAEMALRAWPAS